VGARLQYFDGVKTLDLRVDHRSPFLTHMSGPRNIASVMSIIGNRTWQALGVTLSLGRVCNRTPRESTDATTPGAEHNGPRGLLFEDRGSPS
jgi:hypothetical protein